MNRVIVEYQVFDLLELRTSNPRMIPVTAEMRCKDVAQEAVLSRYARETEMWCPASVLIDSQNRAVLVGQVNQSLTGVLLRLEATRSEAPPGLEPEIEETSRLAHQAMDELLTVARQLRPTALDDLGLRAAIAGLVEQLDLPGMTATFSCEDDPSMLDPDIQLVIYRVSQEAIGNAVRHSDAKAIRVTLARHGDRFELVVSDDGSGFTFEQATSGLGLGGMRERAILVGGDIDIESRTGHGTTVRLSVPVRERSAT